MNWNSRFSSAAIVVVIALASSAHISTAQDDIDSSRRNAIVKAIEKVSPAVVTINVVDVRRERVVDPFFQDFWGLFGPYGANPTRIENREIESVGSGVIIDKEGHILTNYHVLQGADYISSVSLPDGRTLEVELVGADERSDIALLKAQGKDLPYAELGDSEDLIVGEWVIAIGNPFGNMMQDPQPSVSVGVVSANHRRVGRQVGGGDRYYQDLIQTDAAINPGNSGGPLVNSRGQVVGINTMIFSTTGGSQGLGFSIPVNRARRVVDEVLTYGRRRSPWLGFRGEAVGALGPYAMQQLRIAVQSGVVVTEILKGSPAFKAGLQLGDVITSINGEKVEAPQDIDFVVWSFFIGDAVTLEYNRQGKTGKVEFKIEELAER
ncbi:MAG: trypsin-like peptidase domain-containing protein [Candidatus Hydrogenedentes bacterium]|nr:trypsin-like peptidase domain-containing protein [Candidatus Hydrogenedentota bacterium]